MLRSMAPNCFHGWFCFKPIFGQCFWKQIFCFEMLYQSFGYLWIDCFWSWQCLSICHCLVSKLFLIGPQSFTSLKADLCQDINGGLAFSKYLNGTFPWRKCSVKWFGKLTEKRIFVFVTLLIWVNVPLYQLPMQYPLRN